MTINGALFNIPSGRGNVGESGRCMMKRDIERRREHANDEEQIVMG